MSIAPDIEEIEAKSQAFDLLMTEEEVRDHAERALQRAMHAKVWALTA